MEVKVNHVNEPNFVDFTVKTRLPKELERLDEIAHNLWWVWNVDAKRLFRHMDEKMWEDCRHNPISMLESARLDRLVELAADKQYLAELDKVYAKFTAYMNKEHRTDVPSVAYFSMEYGSLLIPPPANSASQPGG